MKTFAIVAATAACFLTPVSIADERFAFDFEFDRNEVKTVEGAEKIYDRLIAEIESECDLGVRRPTLEETRLEQECLEQTADTAVAQIGEDSMDQVHESKS